VAGALQREEREFGLVGIVFNEQYFHREYLLSAVKR
jgi:hypothetical protein